MRLWVAGFVLILQLPCIVVAGECTEGFLNYARYLLEADPAVSDDYSFSCLCCEGDLGGNRWAGPATREVFHECRDDSVRSILVEVGRRYIRSRAKDSPVTRVDFSLALALAYWDIRSVQDFDVFSVIAEYARQGPWEFRRAAMALAALDDPRAIGFMVASYKYYGQNEAGGSKELQVSALNCLYHLSAPEAVEAAQEIAQGEADEFLKSRALRVANRQ